MNNFFLSCENSKNEIIKRAAEFTGRKSYFLIDYTGKVKRKSINLSLPLIAYSNSENMENVLEIISSNYIWKEERKKIKKPDRLTKLSIEELKRNLFKTIQNGEQVFASKFANELFLREKESLKNILLFSACINRENKLLPLLALSAIKLMDEEGSDYYYPLHMIIEILSLYPKNYREYEMTYNGQKSCNGKRESLDDNISIEFQEMAFLKAVEILKNSDIDGVKVLEKMAEKIEINNLENRSEIEKIIVQGMNI